MRWLDVLNSATSFGIMISIAFGVWFLVIKRDIEDEKKTHKRGK